MSFLLAFWIFFLSFGTGLLLLNPIAKYPSDREYAALYFPLGFGVLGYAIFFFGLTGLLSLPLLTVFFTLLSLVALPALVQFFRKGTEALLHSWRNSMKDRFFFLAATGALGVLFLGFLLANTPPSAHDALVYQIQIPKRFAEEGEILYLPYLVNSLFPFLIQMHYTAALVFRSPELTGAIHWMTGFGTFIGILSLGKSLRSLKTGLNAGLIFLLTPGIFKQMTEPLSDIALAFFTFFAVYSSYLAVKEGPALRHFILMGIFSGFALSVKHLAALHITAIFLYWFSQAVKRSIGWSRTLQLLAVYGTAVFLSSFIWYLRSYLYEGNPVYPFFSSIFGGSAGHEYDLGKQGYGKSLLDFILIPWRVTMEPQRFGGTWTQPGVIYLVFLPLLSFYKARSREENFLVSFSAVFFVLWFLVVQNIRFLFPLFPFLALMIARVSQDVNYSKPMLTALLSFNLLLGIFHGRHEWPYLLGLETKEQYLQKKEPSYEIARWVNGRLSEQAVVLNAAEVRMFYFRPDMIRAESFIPRNFPPGSKAYTETDILREFQKQGITHIFHRQSAKPSERTAVLDEVLRQDSNFRKKHLKLLDEYEARGESYRLYEVLYQEVPF